MGIYIWIQCKETAHTLSPDGWTSYAHMEQLAKKEVIMFQQYCLMTLTGVATSSCTKNVYLMIKATRTHTSNA